MFILYILVTLINIKAYVKERVCCYIGNVLTVKVKRTNFRLKQNSHFENCRYVKDVYRISVYILACAYRGYYEYICQNKIKTFHKHYKYTFFKNLLTK